MTKEKRNQEIKRLRDLASDGRNVPELIGNILRFYDMATDAEEHEGKGWYFAAYAFAHMLAIEFGHNTVVVANVLSALSVSNRWESNKDDTITVLKAHVAGLGPKNVRVSTYNNQKEKAFNILVHKDPSYQSGRKTVSFADNIADPAHSEKVTVDRHALGVALNSVGQLHKKVSLTPKRYDNVEEAYRIAAKSRGLLPHQMQAITWTVYRSRYAGRDDR